jgi:hypothetical protein
MEAKAVIFLDWRQSGASGWVEARAGCGSIDFIGGAEWIRGGGALGAPDLYPIQEAGRGASRSRCVVLNT